MNTDLIEERLKDAIQDDVRIVDNGIGPFEFWGAPGVDKRMELETSSVLEIDFTDCLDEEGETPETAVAEGLKLSLSISKSKGGDPDACAESGRRRCGSCDACKTYEDNYTATLTRIENRNGNLVALFNIGD